MKKQLIQKGVIVVAVLFLFVGFVQYREYKDTHFTVNAKTFHVKNSMEKIEDDIYKNYPGLGLKEAFRYGVGKNIDKDIPLVSEQREMRIDKVLLNMGSIYLLYSVDLLKSDKSLKNIPSLEVGKILMHRNNGLDLTATVEQKDFGQPIKITETYNNRVYQHLMRGYDFSDVTFESEGDINHFKEDYLDHVTSITLSDVKIVLGKKKTDIEDLKLPVNFNFDKYLVQTIPVNKTVQLGSTTLEVKNYQRFFDHSELNYGVKNGVKSNVISVMADVNMKEKSKSINWSATEAVPKIFYINDKKQYFPNIDAKSITITPTEYGLLDKMPINIHLDKNKMMELIEHPQAEEKVADIKDGSIFLSMGSGQSRSGFQLIFKYDASSYPHVGQMTWITTGELHNYPEGEKLNYIQDQQVIDIKDGEGHVLNTFINTGAASDAGNDTYSFGGAMIDWINPSGLDITLQSLVYVNKITSDPIIIHLEK